MRRYLYAAYQFVSSTKFILSITRQSFQNQAIVYLTDTQINEINQFLAFCASIEIVIWFKNDRPDVFSATDFKENR